MTKSARERVELLYMALGEPVRSPCEAPYQVFLWGCPVCHGDVLDPEGIHLPLIVDSNGEYRCHYGCTSEAIIDAVEVLLREQVDAA